MINEELGHDRATAVLAAVARHLEGVVRPSDTVGQLDGGTFGCVIEDLSSQEDAKDFAARVEAALAEPIQIDGREVEVKAGMGIALGNRTIVAGGDLIRDAMTALTRAKDEPGVRAAVVNEGIERHDQLVMIRKAGCDFAQGFLFAPSLEVEDAEKLAATGRLAVI